MNGSKAIVAHSQAATTSLTYTSSQVTWFSSETKNSSWLMRRPTTRAHSLRRPVLRRRFSHSCVSRSDWSFLSICHQIQWLPQIQLGKRKSRRTWSASSAAIAGSPSVASVSTSAEADDSADGPTVSIIVPVYNEVGNIPKLIQRIVSVMERHGGLFEIICVDDGSTDGSAKVLRALAGEVNSLRVVLLRRNFGQTAAMAAGFDYAGGDIIVSLDGDLQNDPNDIPQMINYLLCGPKAEPVQKWGTGTRREDGGYDMVCGWRKNRKDNALSRTLPSRVANWLIGKVTGVRLHDYGCSLKAYRASLLSLLRVYGEMHRFLPALAAMEGAAIAELEVNHHPRTSGKSKYGLSRIPRVLLDLLTVFFLARFRDRPMHFVGPLGGLCLLASGAFGAYFCHAFFSALQRYGSLLLAWSTSFAHLVASVELLVMGAQVRPAPPASNQLLSWFLAGVVLLTSQLADTQNALLSDPNMFRLWHPPANQIACMPQHGPLFQPSSMYETNMSSGIPRFMGLVTNMTPVAFQTGCRYFV